MNHVTIEDKIHKTYLNLRALYNNNNNNTINKHLTSICFSNCHVNNFIMWQNDKAKVFKT